LFARTPLRWFALLAVTLGWIAGTSAAHAHASLLSTEPPAGAVLEAAPERIILVFNEPISPLRLQLISAGGEPLVLSHVVQHDATLIAPLPATLGQGTHVLSWRVVSADGHPVGGTLVFSVGQADAAPPLSVETTDVSVLAAIWLVKLLVYAALFFGVGGVFFRAWIAAAWPPAEAADKGIRGLLIAGLLAAPLSIGLQGLDGLTLSFPALTQSAVWKAGFDTSYGASAVIAMLAMAAALSALGVLDRSAARLRSAIGLIAVGFALAASGHAASTMPQWLMRPAVFVHVAAVAFWLGALGPLSSMLGGAGGGASLRRFSRAIPSVLVLLAMAGIILAVVQLETIAALWTTAYGRLFLAKMAGVVLLLARAGVNRFMLTARAEAGDAGAVRRLRHVIMAECVVAVLILAIVAGWRFTPPPRAIAAAAAAPEFVHFHGEKFMADITLDPGRVGRSRANIVIRAADYGPMTPKGVTLVLSQGAAGIEPLRREAADAGNYSWRIDDLVIPAAGRWHLRIEVLVSDFEKAALEDDIEISN
jgi:copper transport protein